MNGNSTEGKRGPFSTWQQDLLSSLVVFFVALPLCMAIALASGAPVATGLVTGIIGGIIVGFLSGAPLQVSGPAAGLTVVCAEVIRQHGVPALGIVVLIAGVLQLVAGLCRFGQWFRAVSPAVVHGMLSGIGVLILTSQLHVLVDSQSHGHGLANLREIPAAIQQGLPLPEWEEAPVRQARIELLQKTGQLHELQDEVERGVARIVTQHGSEALHAQEESLLPTFAPQQQAVLNNMQALKAKFESSALAPTVRGKQVSEAFAAAEESLRAALLNLEQHQLVDAEQRQHSASVSIENVVGELKSPSWAGKVGLLAIAIVAAWNALARGRLKLVPAPLLAVLATTLLAWQFAIPVRYVEVPESLVSGLTFPAITVFEDAAPWDLLMAGIMMAVIASAETLLSAAAVDRMHTGPRAQFDRELFAQGVGNVLCGCLGALPMTGVIVRSAANVQSGAKSRMSTILHGTWLLMFVLLLAPLLRMIPVSALAGILVYMGFKLIDFKGFRHMWKESRSEAFIFLATLIVIVAEGLLEGVVTGVILSAVKLLVTFSHLDVRISNLPADPRRVTVSLTGAATFLRLPVLAAKLEEVPKNVEVKVDLENLDYVDHACLELIMSWAQQHEAGGGSVEIDWGHLQARFRGPRRKKEVSSEPTHSAA